MSTVKTPRPLRPAVLFLVLTTALAGCGVKENDLHQRLAPMERQTEELQSDQQALQQRLEASEAEMNRLRAELDALRPGSKKGSGTKQSSTASGTPPRASAQGSTGSASSGIPAPKVLTAAEAAEQDRRLAAATAAPAAPAATAASPTAAGTATPTTSGPIHSGTLTVVPPPVVVKPTPAAPPAASPVSPPARLDNEQAAYKQALDTYERRRFDEAEALFDTYLSTWPNGKLAPNALYWKAECLYSRGRFADAIFIFKDVMARFPRHGKAPDSLLKAIMTYKRLGDMDNARLHYSVLAEDYPASSALKRAKELGLDG